jgi:pimeloyl-ACP methyl ester carboxylesterase/DNA-binding CsgD family transcriptional regulator
MAVDIRYCMTVDGVRIAYSVAGSGPPLVRVLGWLSNLEFSPDYHPIWGPWHNALTPQHQLVTYDGRGCGLSDRAIADLSIAAKMRDVEAVVAALGLPQVALIGTSDGAAVAIAYAARHPERVSRLVLYNALAYSDLSTANPEGFAALLTMVRQCWGQDNPAFRQYFAGLLYPDADSAFYAWFDALQRAASTAEEAAAFVAANGAFDVREQLGQLTMPTLVLHRRGDLLCPFEGGRELAASIVGARFVPLEGRNHFVLPGEAAATVLFPALVDFLQDGAPSTPGDRGAYPDGLTAREVEVLRLIASGHSSREIAAALVIAEPTVTRHVTNLYAKIGARSRADATAYAFRHQVVPAPAS